MKKISVAVLMGGKSSENEVSLASGIQVVKHLDEKKFNVLPIVISPDGKKWNLVNTADLLNANVLNAAHDTKGNTEIAHERQITLNELQEIGIDVVFIAMHGQYGEDGTIQGMLEILGIPYTGSGILASALGIDKLRFRKLLQFENIKVPKYITHEQGSPVPESISFPCVVKPNNQGSSVGVTILKNKTGFKKAIDEAHEYSDVVLIDEYLGGVELTCAVLGNKKPYALPLVEIIPENDFFDYKSKYLSNKTQEIVPARVTQTLTKRIQEIAIHVHKLVGASGFSRVDFILKDTVPYVLEINTIPGLTESSLLPKAAFASGLSYSQLLEKVVNYAFEKTL